MKKAQLIESVRQLILRQQPTQDSLKTVHPRVVEAEVSKAYNTVVKTYFESNVRLMESELDFYCKKYTLTLAEETYLEDNALGVEETKYTGRRYATLTARPIELKKNLGLRSVKPRGGLFSCVRSSEGEVETLRELDVYCCMNKVFFYLDGNKLMFETGVAEWAVVDNVDVKMMPVFEDFGDDDYIDFPLGDEQAIQMIMQVMGFRVTDNTNDDVR